MRRLLALCCVVLSFPSILPAQRAANWRAATPEELEAVLPARAPVEKERIETEMRTATGIVNERKQVIAAVVLITAGYAADGKYSHFVLVQSPVLIGDHSFAPGTYVVGWKHAEDGLLVKFFDASSGAEKATLLAKPLVGSHRIESFHIWPPGERSLIQIGRYMLPYSFATE